MGGLAACLFFIAPYELQLRGIRSASCHWLGWAIRRENVHVDFSRAREHLLSDPDHLVCDVDGDRLIVSINFVRVTMDRQPNGIGLTFRFPIGLVVFFCGFCLVCVVIASQLPAANLGQLAGLMFMVTFMVGLPLVMWRILHSVAVGETEAMIQGLSLLADQKSGSADF